MSMRRAIENFWEQFSFQPTIVNREALPLDYDFVIVCGMGGSHLAADLMKSIDTRIFVHSDYGLPRLPDTILKRSLCIVDSYSGNTEEVIDTLEHLTAKGYHAACITTGGILLKKAQDLNLPHIIIPNTGIQPRAALGYQIIALHAVLGITIPNTTREPLMATDDTIIKSKGIALATTIHNTTPIIYGSEINKGLAYFFKITLNETGKIPAFYNTIPEMNHNEITGFATKPSSPGLTKYTAVFLTDDNDTPRTQQRFALTQTLLHEQGMQTTKLVLPEQPTLIKTMRACHIAMWCALHIAELTQADPEGVPIIETFKERL